MIGFIVYRFLRRMLQWEDIYTVYSLGNQRTLAYILYIVYQLHLAYIYIVLQIFHSHIWSNILHTFYKFNIHSNLFYV